MKMGVRKPSIKKSITARTTGRVKRSVKKATVPGYGEKGTGIIKDPKKAVYNKVYNTTTTSAYKAESDLEHLGCLTASIIAVVLFAALIVFIVF